jgi:transcriptional regulator with XRE-family HTH domain
MRGRKERELELPVSFESTLGAAIRAWRRYRGLSVTDLAMRAGFGHNGRGYISKIEHNQIKRLGNEAITSIAQALNLSPLDLQQLRLPEIQGNQKLDKDTLDDAIIGCEAWLRVYSQDDRPLDCARTYLKLAELYWERLALAEGKRERERLLADALQSINQALPLFYVQAPDSYEQALNMRSLIEKTIFVKDLDDAIAGCKALLKIYAQEKKTLDWARTHTKLAQLYWDRSKYTEKGEEQSGLFVQALQSLDQALPFFQQLAPVSYKEVQKMRTDIEMAREALSRQSF